MRTQIQCCSVGIRFRFACNPLWPLNFSLTWPTGLKLTWLSSSLAHFDLQNLVSFGVSRKHRFDWLFRITEYLQIAILLSKPILKKIVRDQFFVCFNFPSFMDLDLGNHAAAVPDRDVSFYMCGLNFVHFLFVCMCGSVSEFSNSVLVYLSTPVLILHCLNYYGFMLSVNIS